ncbi:MAG: CRISPR-associated endonuclease Cas3'' [Acidobacteria bacterium]|nr:MAG: CRISPR-associated endonuclease Cas3'' [Acidobacteriota bacterium]
MRKPLVYAHSLDGAPESAWHELRDHLEATGELAARFSEAFGAGDWGRILGLWHDLGKYHPQFQAYLRGESPSGGDHSIVGALLAESRRDEAGGAWIPLALAIAGHHAGLARPGEGAGRPTPLRSRLRALRSRLDETPVPENLKQHPLPAVPERFRSVGSTRLERQAFKRRLALWTRFVFSALVDADRLDTERFYDGPRRLDFDPLATLRRRLDDYVDDLAAGAAQTPLNALRRRILDACRQAAVEAPGLFSLSVPTGGGKTLAAMSFALRHAEKHGLQRIIVAIPFTSIIEQTVDVYRRALGPEQVIEHHSALDPDPESEDDRMRVQRNKLASENWDAPLVVTTNVQLFESLYANKPGRCRKLHNVARSVILLDEPQSLPPAQLLPILAALRHLVMDFGCTVLFSTATQPAFNRSQSLPKGFDGVREIAPDPAALARALKRYEVRWPAAGDEPVSWPELAGRLSRHQQVLAIVHRRRDARELAQAVGEDDGVYHLSASMCAAHRRQVLSEVGRRLADGGPCRLIATQVVEAGVDVDFPFVYRALGGLDSLVQAGGRANREGRLEVAERLIVFRAPTRPPPGTPQRGLEVMEQLLEKYDGTVDVHQPEVVSKYFELLYSIQTLDRDAILAHEAGLDFPAVARAFRLIDDAWSAPLVVRWGDGARRLERLRQQGPSRDRLRALQPFTVNVNRHLLPRLEQDGVIEHVAEVVHALSPGYERLYSERYGLILDPDGPIHADPLAFMV